MTTLLPFDSQSDGIPSVWSTIVIIDPTYYFHVMGTSRAYKISLSQLLIRYRQNSSESGVVSIRLSQNMPNFLSPAEKARTSDLFIGRSYKLYLICTKQMRVYESTRKLTCSRDPSTNLGKVKDPGSLRNNLREGKIHLPHIGYLVGLPNCGIVGSTRAMSI